MPTFSSSIVSKEVSNLISKKPYLISTEELKSLGSEINLVGVDPLKDLETVSQKSFSPRLINWVDAYLVGGVSKTLFYTEVNTNLKVGDRVFIINGNYDNDNLIKSDKYKKGRDGYKVLFVDKCQVVLDIDYTGVNPYNTDEVDNFINVYYIKNQNDFLHVNRQTTTRGGIFDYKFNPYQNNIIYVDQDYGITTNWGYSLGLTNSPGFFVKNGTASWIDITSSFIQGSFSIALSGTYSNNNRVRIHYGTFTYSIGVDVVEFKEGFTYNWAIAPEPNAISGTTSTWIVDSKYSRPFLTKGNFRDGNFTGIWNSGLYGRQDKTITWEGEKSTWNGGTLLNTQWKKGIINSKYSSTDSYFAGLDADGSPFQKTTAANNNGRGYNFIIDSNLETSIINNGSIESSTIGKSTTYSIVEDHLLSNTVTYDNKINKAFFNRCDFIGGYVSNAELKNIKADNTRFQNVKSLNSHYKKSVIKDSNYLSDEIIKILGYDEFLLADGINPSPGITSHKVYKFYISKSDFERLESRDHFYIKGLKFNDNSRYPINFFDRLFRISSYTEYIDYNSIDVGTGSNGVLDNTFYKRGVDFSAFLSTPGDNEWKYNAYDDGVNTYTTVIEQGEKKYSIDIVTSILDKNGKSLEFNFNTHQIISTTSPMMNTIGDIVDISSAYILDSDFESGIFETSNWNSGYHIEYSNDNNITNYTYEGGFYNLTIVTSSSTLIANTLQNLDHKEQDDEFNIGDIVFLNGIDYDTRGKVETYVINSPGSSYISTTGVTVSGSGNNLTFDIIAATIGSVTAITITHPGASIINGNYTNLPTTTGGLGTGLTLDVTVNISGVVIAATISSPGIGYLVSDVVDITIPAGTPPQITVDAITNGEVLSVSVVNTGIGYQTGETVILEGGDYLGTVDILSTTGSLTRLPDAYKITNKVENGTYSVLDLQEVITGTISVITPLLDGGLFYTNGANNRWGYISLSKFKQAKIKSGFFRRSYLSGSLIEDDSYDVADKDFDNLTKIKNLLISDTLFANNSNTLSKALYINSSIVNGSDKFNNGIVYNSIWNGSTFSNGTFKQSTWLDGVFNNGLFYNNRSFDATPTFDFQYYDVDRIKSYYKSGSTVSNDRYSWRNGTMNGGDFYKSDWENGTLKNGRFAYSKFYNGQIDGGIIGDKAVPTTNTRIYNAVINNTTVEDATLYAIDTSYSSGSTSSIQWNNGIFNLGVFGSSTTQSRASATWENGIFNGGQFISDARWKDGKFNGGKFISSYGWAMSNSVSKSDYTWENGEFNGGEFGNGELLANSTWYTGELNGGIFKGRVWNDGIFIGGEIQGSSTYSSVGGFENKNAYDFTNSLSSTSYFYGLWRNGLVSPNKDKFIKDDKIFTEITLAKKTIKEVTTTIKNTLWLNGTFSHPNAVANNIVWLDGAFESGTFKNSSFNPFVKRNGLGPSFNTNDDTCYWENGKLDDSEFNYSRWKNGKFIIGTANGMIWENGVTEYMNANNVFWENGLWRNGNWQGSEFDYSGAFSNYTKAILQRGMSWSGTQSLHVWNLFQGNVISKEIADKDASRVYNRPFPEFFDNEEDLAFYWENSNGDNHWNFDNIDLINIDSAVLDDELSNYLDYKIFTKKFGNLNSGSPNIIKFSKDKNYQITTTVKGLTAGASFSVTVGKYEEAAFNWNRTIIYDKSPNESVEIDLVFISNPRYDTTLNSTSNILSFRANGRFDDSLGGGGIVHVNILEMDYKIQGYSMFSTAPYQNGWVYSNDLIKWRLDADSVIYPLINSNSSSPNFNSIHYLNNNYIAKRTTSERFNLSFRLSSVYPSLLDLKVYTTDYYLPTAIAMSNPNHPGVLVGTVKLSNTYNFYNLSGNYVYFVAGTTSAWSNQTVEFDIYDLQITSDYSEDTNQLFIFNDSLTTNNIPTNATYSTVVVSSSTYHHDGLNIFGATGSEYQFFTNLLGTVSNLALLKSNIGNGSFKAGVWENGVWNNGWRSDENIFDFDDITIAYKQQSDVVWRFQISGPTSSVEQFTIGDKISIGNIIAIDINESRKPLKSLFTIINKGESSIIVEAKTAFPFRRIEKDSSNHKIRVTKNVWLNGGFLNGYFEGIWNDGLFKGYPYLTEMYNTQWIDGRFDGGHFHSTFNSATFSDIFFINSDDLGLDIKYNAKVGLSFSTPHIFLPGDKITIIKDLTSINPNYDGDTTVIYKLNDFSIIVDKSFGNNATSSETGTIKLKTATGLIQNFKFKDNNVGTGTNLLYNSWIDVNYLTQSSSTINRNQLLFSPSIGEYSKVNLYGYVTNDVLSSESIFRDSFSSDKTTPLYYSQVYNLGTKYKIYEDYLGDISEFNEPFDSDILAGGLDNFYNNGWTFSTALGVTVTLSRTDDQSLEISTTPEIIPNFPVPDTGDNNLILNNTNINIDKRRYSLIEFNLNDYTNITNIDFRNVATASNLPISTNVKHLEFSDTKKYEYFFNRKSLSLYFENSPTSISSLISSIDIDNVKFYEVDMIPFFQYTTSDQVNKRVQIPYRGVSPVLDFSNLNTTFIDNIIIGLDSLVLEIGNSGVGGSGGISNTTEFISISGEPQFFE